MMNIHANLFALLHNNLVHFLKLNKNSFTQIMKIIVSWFVLYIQRVKMINYLLKYIESPQ